MSQALQQRNTDISQVLTLLCEAGAIARGCGTCAYAQDGVVFVNLLADLQSSYQTSAWTFQKLTDTLAYMRARGVVVVRNGLYYLNYDMAKLGGTNEVWALMCPKVEQPNVCTTTQVPKYGSLPPMVEVPLSDICQTTPLPDACILPTL